MNFNFFSPTCCLLPRQWIEVAVRLRMFSTFSTFLGRRTNKSVSTNLLFQSRAITDRPRKTNWARKMLESSVSSDNFETQIYVINKNFYAKKKKFFNAEANFWRKHLPKSIQIQEPTFDFKIFLKLKQKIIIINCQSVSE